MSEYYTYAYLREDNTPYYIGKGKGKRIYSTWRTIKPPKDKSRIIYLKQNLTEEEAFRHEIYMIDVFGRKDLGTGILHNMTNGGEGPSGAIRSEETRRKIGEAQKNISEETRRKIGEAKKGENNPNYGKTASEETKKRMSDAHKNPSEETRKKLSDAHKNPSEETRRKLSEVNKGKTRSEESKIKMSEAQKGRTHSEETKRKLSDANRGENNPSYGKTHSEETKKRMSDAHKNPPEEIRKKQSVAMSGRKWWNDGCGNVKLMIECPDDGWKLGMKPNGIKDEI